MADRERIPHALAPFLQLPPEHTQTLITSVLGASANWLIVQHLASLLGSDKHGVHADDDADRDQTSETGVILVSWMRQWDFWRTESRRSVGLDLQQLHENGRFIFIDGLSHLFVPAAESEVTNTNARARADGSTSPDIRRAQQHPVLLENPTPDHMHQVLSQAIAKLKASGPSNVVLMLDTPNILLQTTTPPIDTLLLSRVILQLRMQVHSFVLSLPADDAFLAPAAALDIQEPGLAGGITTPLDADNAAFITGMGHQSHILMQCRRLETGWAEDVSGVLRITAGADDMEIEDVGVRDKNKIEEGEWLYLVGTDGSIKVWSRGTNA